MVQWFAQLLESELFLVWAQEETYVPWGLCKEDHLMYKKKICQIKYAELPAVVTLCEEGRSCKKLCRFKTQSAYLKYYVTHALTDHFTGAPFQPLVDMKA